MERQLNVIAMPGYFSYLDLTYINRVKFKFILPQCFLLINTKLMMIQWLERNRTKQPRNNHVTINYCN